nr:glycosyltransferase family 2 protein [Roseivivax halotolerans]
MMRWGIVATIKAPLPRILDFAAWHLDLGAERLFLYLDDGDSEAARVLNAHPQINVTETGPAYWKNKGGRPDMHQNRQCRNARHAYNRAGTLDWIAHIDVDEFLLPEGSVSAALASLPKDALCARMRPAEALARESDTPARDSMRHFKAFHVDQTARQDAAQRIFGDASRHLSGGFLSHVAGKLFIRTGHKGLQIRIHNIRLGDVQNPGEVALPDIPLGHFHAESWEAFLAAYRFRVTRGSYRAELKPQARGSGALKLHDLFTQIEADEGESGLRRFYDIVALATPDLRSRLAAEGLLVSRRMDLPALVARHFGHERGSR